MSSSGSMFGDLIEWFTGKGDRRQYKRRAGAFHLWLMTGPKPTDAKPGRGLEISANGLVFIIPERITEPQFNVVVALRETKMPLRLKLVRSDQIEHGGKPWYRYMCEFVGVAADHWDRIVRYVEDEPEPLDRKANPEPVKQDDAYRLLPLAIQQKIIAKLVEQNKLDPPGPGQTPLVKIFYAGQVVRPGQKPAHRVNVHSRKHVKDEVMAYDTRFLVTDEGEITTS
jgi:hypothetical protein